MADEDPFKAADGTSLRPRPGAGRRGWHESSRVRPPAAAVEPEPIPEPAREMLGIGLNPLVRGASALLLLGGQLRGSVSPMDVDGLRRHALDEIRRFEDRARAAGVANEVVISARYVLCAHLDEALLSTPWGSQSEWAQHPLLVTLHREAWGGEKFFDMLDRVMANPAQYLDLMELQYLCLALGFGGKYHRLPRGQEQLAAIQQDVYRRIRAHREETPLELSPRWRGVEDRRNPLVRYVPWWVMGIAALALLAVVFTLFYSRLASAARPVQAALARIGTEEVAAPVPVRARGPRLRQLLQPEIQKGLLTVDEDSGRSVVTLPASDLFASGSAVVNAAHVGTLQQVARAVNQVEGHVIVAGHTDNQPIRSLRFADNFELSRERAHGVAQILQAGLANPARVEARGMGDEQPKYTPASDPANRARNRRVEIIHVEGS